MNSNHWPFPYQGSALPTELRERGAPVRNRTDFSCLQNRTSSFKGFRGIDKNKGSTRLPLNCYGMEYSHNKGRSGYTYASIKLDTICFSIARSVHKNPVKNGRDVMWYVNVWLWHTSLPIQKKLVEVGGSSHPLRQEDLSCLALYSLYSTPYLGGPPENRTPTWAVQKPCAPIITSSP